MNLPTSSVDLPSLLRVLTHLLQIPVMVGTWTQFTVSTSQYVCWSSSMACSNGVPVYRFVIEILRGFPRSRHLYAPPSNHSECSYLVFHYSLLSRVRACKMPIFTSIKCMLFPVL